MTEKTIAGNDVVSTEQLLLPEITSLNETLAPLPCDQDPNTPPAKIARNKYGLLMTEKYIFDDRGYVDYKKMVDPKFLYINPDARRRSKIEAKYGKKFEDIKIFEDKVDDNDLVIQLGGLKNLLRIRGYYSVSTVVNRADASFASVTCTIYFIGNYETLDCAITYSDSACATVDNTTNFGRQYLVEIATNRAFCRCIRNFLNINIVAQEELGNNFAQEQPEDMAVTTLRGVMSQYNITFERIKARLLEDKYPNAENFKDVTDIPRLEIFNLIKRIKEKAAEKEATK